jgi:hypothetical protein
MGAAFQLVMRSGPTPNQAYPLEKMEIFIGRELNNDVVINDPEVSRKHARIYTLGTGYVIQDLQSTNGTAINGQRIKEEVPLRPGDLITFGDKISLVFEALSINAAATVTVAAVQPPPPPAYTPPQPPPYQPPTPQPVQPVQPDYGYNPGFAGQVPAAPPPAPPKKKSGSGVVIALVIILVLCVLCSVLGYVGWSYGDQIMQQLKLTGSLLPTMLVI